MVTQLCGAGCGTSGKPRQSYRDFCDEVVLRKYGQPFYALVDCNVNIPDITDLAAVAALVASGDIHIGPMGKLDIPPPTVVTSSDINICAGDTVVSTTYALTFSTYHTDYEDVEYWADLLKRHKNFRLVYFDCDENFYAQGEYIDYIRDSANAPAPVGNPGFEFTVTAPPHPTEGDGGKVRWDVTFSIELSGSEIIRYGNIPGLFNAFKPV